MHTRYLDAGLDGWWDPGQSDAVDPDLVWAMGTDLEPRYHSHVVV